MQIVVHFIIYPEKYSDVSATHTVTLNVEGADITANNALPFLQQGLLTAINMHNKAMENKPPENDDAAPGPTI